MQKYKNILHEKDKKTLNYLFNFFYNFILFICIIYLVKK